MQLPHIGISMTEPLFSNALNTLGSYMVPAPFSNWLGRQVSCLTSRELSISSVFYKAVVGVSIFALWYFLSWFNAPGPRPEPEDSTHGIEGSPDDKSALTAELNVQLDELLRNITPEAVAAFRTQVENRPDQESAPVLEIKSILDYLDTMIRGRDQYAPHWQYRHNDELNTIRVPSDGNCLFHAFGIVLSLTREAAPMDHAEMRQSVAGWIERQYLEAEKEGGEEQGPDCEHPRILDYLRASIESYQAVRRLDLEGELASLNIQEGMGEDPVRIAAARKQTEAALGALPHLTRAEYVTLCRGDQFHGGPAEIYALSEMFRVRIEIERLYVKYDRDGQIVSQRRIAGFDRVYGAQYHDRVVLVNMGGDHYDATLPT